jgi:hypothetical protein
MAARRDRADRLPRGQDALCEARLQWREAEEVRWVSGGVLLWASVSGGALIVAQGREQGDGGQGEVNQPSLSQSVVSLEG